MLISPKEMSMTITSTEPRVRAMAFGLRWFMESFHDSEIAPWAHEPFSRRSADSLVRANPIG